MELEGERKSEHLEPSGLFDVILFKLILKKDTISLNNNG